MLDAWRLDVLGRVNVAQGLGGHYGFQPAVIRQSDGHESGPVVVGYRLRTSETPMDYRLLVYEKGAFILHMIRMMLMDLESGDDTRFRELMTRFVDEHRERPASTRAFEAAVARAFGEPMDWFFDQWVYGVDVPSYRPNLEVSPVVDQELPFLLHGTIDREDVPDDFRMPVPIALQFGRPSTHRAAHLGRLGHGRGRDTAARRTHCDRFQLPTRGACQRPLSHALTPLPLDGDNRSAYCSGAGQRRL